MFQGFPEHQEDYVIDYLQEYIEDFLMNEFHAPNLLEQKLKMLDESIMQAEGKTDCGQEYSAHYGYENNILKRIQIRRELGASELEISEYRKKYRHFSAIRSLEIQEYLEKESTRKRSEFCGRVKNQIMFMQALSPNIAKITLSKKTGYDG